MLAYHDLIGRLQRSSRALYYQVEAIILQSLADLLQRLNVLVTN